jgi:membrane fusion protein (multidrug efflux system)
LRYVSPGAYLNSGDVITTLDDLSIIKVDFNIPERYLPTIAIGQAIDAYNSAYDNEKFEGQVFSIGSRVDAITRTVKIRAKIDNSDLKLRPGMLMGIQIERQVDNVILLPESAIIPIEDKHYVYAVENNKAKRLTVELGRRKPGLVEIVSGLAQGQQIVIEGALKLKPGTDVRVLEPSA